METLLEPVRNTVSLLGWQVRKLSAINHGERGRTPPKGTRGVIVAFTPHSTGHDWIVQWETGQLHFCERTELDLIPIGKARKPVAADMDSIKAELTRRAIIFELALADGSTYLPKTA